MSWTVQLDPSALMPDRVMLDLNEGPIRVASIDWGQAAIDAHMAQQGKYGNAPVDFDIPNRTVTIGLGLGMDDSGDGEAARASLAMKCARLQAEGGVLLRQRDSGPVLYADVVNATLTIPDVWAETGNGLEPDVVLVLECLPDFYGDEITLDAISATGVCASVLQEGGLQAVIEGDYSARCRIIVTDESGVDQHGLIWGVRSRHYDSASTAALFYEAEDMSPINGAASATLSGTSGGHAVEIIDPPAGTWTSMLVTTLASGGPLTHLGSYRVRARCYATGDVPQVRLLWGVGSLAVPIANDPVTLPDVHAFYLLDLGVVRLDAQAVGANEWVGVFQVNSSTVASAYIDCVYLEPLDEASGELSYVSVASPSLLSAVAGAGAGADDNGGGGGIGTVTWSNPGNIIGGGPGQYADAIASASANSHYLEATTFGLSVPSGATVKGIQLDVSRSAVFVSGFDFVTDNRISLIKAGTVQSTNRGTSSRWLRNSFETATYGGPADLWGGSWTPSDVNATDFGAAISALCSNADGRVATVIVTVYYTFGPGFLVAQDATIYAGHAAELRTEGMWRTADATVYGPMSRVLGDLPRLPASGVEQRPVEVFVKPSRGNLEAEADSALDGVSVQVKYRPCYLSRI